MLVKPDEMTEEEWEVFLLNLRRRRRRLRAHLGAGSTPGVLRVTISDVADFVGNVRQSNFVGASINGGAAFVGDISLSAGVQIGTVVSQTVSFVGNVTQTNQISASLSGTAGFAGDIASASAWDYDAEYMLNF